MALLLSGSTNAILKETQTIFVLTQVPILFLAAPDENKSFQNEHVIVMGNILPEIADISIQVTVGNEKWMGKTDSQ